MAVERHTLLSKPRKNGSTLFSHMEQVAEGSGTWPEEYKPIPPPDGSDFIWDIFWEIRNSVPTGFNGPVRLSFQDFDAWQRVRGVKLGNYVVDAFLQMDIVYITEWYRETGKKTSSKKQ